MLQNEKNSDCKQKHLIIYAALDWGLGHSTRSVVIIKYLIQAGCKVVVACNSTQKEIFQAEFTDLEYVHLAGYNVRYSRNALLTKILLIWQLPHILTRIKKENHWLNMYLSRNTAAAVISDNRYGLYSTKTPCVFITHQLAPKSGGGFITDAIARKFLNRYVNRFTECWVPDFEDPPGIAGALSHPAVRPSVPVKYLGAISRMLFARHAVTNEAASFETTSLKVLIIFSGPEPQRSILERIIVADAKSFKGEIILVRGLPINNFDTNDIPGIKYYDYLPGERLAQLAKNADYVICRAGYTSIMDMLLLKKKLILIPTPGQAEQEYLADHLLKNKFAVSFRQNKFFLPEAVEFARNYQYEFPENRGYEYITVVQQFLNQLLTS